MVRATYFSRFAASAAMTMALVSLPSPAVAGDWLQLTASGGPCLAGLFVDSYGTADGHSESASASFGLQADLTLDFLDFLTVGTRFAWLDLAPAPQSNATLFPSIYAGLKTPSFGTLPEAFVRVGASLASGQIGEPDYYPIGLDFMLFGTVGARMILPEAAPLAGWGLYVDVTAYVYIEGTIPSVSLGVVKSLW